MIKIYLMKKITNVSRSALLLFIVLFVHFLFGSSVSSFEANKESELISENLQIRNEYIKLEERLFKMEGQLNEVREYNNLIYSQILGIDFDTTNFHLYRNDSARTVFDVHDSLFNEIDERTIHAAEMLALQLEKLQETTSLFKQNKNAILYYPNISPINTVDFIKITSEYGYRTHPIDNVVLFHEGIDISATVGTPIRATAQGRVVEVMYSKYGYGNRVLIKHAYGFETLYAHMDVINVKKGQWLKKGQKIGTVGNSGKSTGPHLHYEIRKNGEPRDPLGYFYTYLTDELLAMK